MLNQNTALYGILTFALASPVYASLNCTSHPSCESLGYSKTETCSDGKLIQCPFDTSYKKCVKELVYDELCSQYPLAECPAGASCYKCENGKPNYMAYGCSSGYTNLNGDCVKAYEDCSSAGYEYSDNRGKVCAASAEITLLDGSKTMCYTSCVDAYEDCSAAGYGYENNTGMYCSGQGEITLLDGTTKTCYSNCVSVYEDCSAAGYGYDNNEGLKCNVSDEITLPDGSKTMCYDDCRIITCENKLYRTCSDVGAGYVASTTAQSLMAKNEGWTCEAETVNLTNGSTTTCYNCKSACDAYGYYTRSELADFDKIRCDEKNVSIGSGKTTTCYHDCVSTSTGEPYNEATVCGSYERGKYCVSEYKNIRGEKTECYSCVDVYAKCSDAGSKYSSAVVSGKTCNKVTLLSGSCGETISCYYCNTPSTGGSSSGCGSSRECCLLECNEEMDRNLAAGAYGYASRRYEECVEACN